MPNHPLFDSPPDMLCADIATPEELHEVVPCRGQTALVTTRRAMSGWHWLPVLCDRGNGHGHCRRAIVTTYNMSCEAVAGLEQLLQDETIELADVVLSDSMVRLSDGATVYRDLAVLAERFAGRFRWRAGKVHAKTIGCHMASGIMYTIIGSGNMAYNTNHEAYVVLTDEAAFLHLAAWVGSLLR
jgi:hypothetical protein